MRILLIYPTITRAERYSSSIGESGGSQIPLGILYLASFMRSHGHEVMVIDGEANKLSVEQVLERIAEFAPDLVGISSTTVVFHRATELANRIKQVQPTLTTVIGGPHASSNPHMALSQPAFDYGVIGEGEETLLELCLALTNGGDVSHITGLVHRQADEIVINPSRPYILDLDRIPFPAYDLLPDLLLYTPSPSKYKKLPVVNIITSRGCPNQCTFCDKSVFGSRFRPRSARNIADEISLLHGQYGTREIAFVDDTFTVGKRRVYELFDLLRQEGLSFPWTCMTHVASTDRDLIRFMKDRGCWHVSLGIESGDPGILKTIRKGISLDQIRNVVKWCHEVGIRTGGFFMVGHPGETLETIEKTIRFALDLPLNDVVVTINTPIPGSVQYEEALQYGTLDEDDWSQFNCWRPVFVPRGLSEEILIEKHREFYRRFYLRLPVMMRYLKDSFSRSGIRRILAVVRSLPFLFSERRV